MKILRSAFTMIELIGALAVIALLVGVIAPSVVRRVDRAVWTKETADLQAIADSYAQYILRKKTIPACPNWATTVADEMFLPVSKITTNSRGYARAFLVDPNLRLGANGGSGLPYTQDANGSAAPISARVMIVSSLTCPLPVASSDTNADFNTLWNTSENTKPATPTWDAWPGKGEELQIKRLNLERLFYQLVLVDRDPANPARFSIDTNSPVMIVPTGGLGWNKYYFDGTVVGLHATNGLVQSRHRLTRNISFTFDAGAWPGDKIPGRPPSDGTGAEFVEHALAFLNTATSPYAAKGGT